MVSIQERKQNRLYSGLADTLTERQYNFVIGGCLVYGFLLNVIIVIFLVGVVYEHHCRPRSFTEGGD